MKDYKEMVLILVLCMGLLLATLILFRADFEDEPDPLDEYLKNVSPVALKYAAGEMPANNAQTPYIAQGITPDAITGATPRIIAWVNDIIAQVKPSVVGICVGDITQLAPWQQGWEIFSPTGKRSVGSGIIVDPRGYVLTNYHVIAVGGDIMITLFDGQSYKDYPAEFIAGDEKSDMAILKITANQSLPSAPLGDSDKVLEGDKVIAIGNPFGLTQTVTSGIISARRKRLPIDGIVLKNVFQTDVPINPGNSGGALVNLKGEVIGVNVAIYSPQESIYTGISFAIPINNAKKLFSNYMDTTKISQAAFQYSRQDLPPDMPADALAGYQYTAGLQTQAGVQNPIQPSPGEGIEELSWLGIDFVPVNDVNTQTSQIQIDEVEGISPMEAGLEAGDILMAVNGYATPNIYELKNVIKKIPLEVGQGVVLDVYRPRSEEFLFISFRLKEWDIKGR